MTCESYVTMAADSSIHVSTIPFRLLKRLPRSDMPGCLVASRLIARLRHRFPTMTGDRLIRWHVVAEGTEGEIKKELVASFRSRRSVSHGLRGRATALDERGAVSKMVGLRGRVGGGHARDRRVVWP